MPPKSSSNGNAHEARIQRLEDGLSELKASHAEVSANLRNLGSQVEASASTITSHIDAIVKPLHDTLHDHIKEDTLSRTKLDALGITVDRIEEDRAAKLSRSRAWKAALLAVITGAIAIGLKELMVYLAHHI